ncbi:lipoprotein [Dielma fastidiosa]|jgi:hypothetical protein|uniref:LptM family lipoprotein n=1 Tax=Dielma fastidiosa TaxID=1034346 RepID=UPI0023EFFF82|nr:hypothetical protein [Dielma fastidiosa]MBS6169662.1 hypothetical protein [Bacillota bacterium]
MKKILTSFLLMAMIAGCVQQGPTEAEKPEEPPVVEQPEKPVEQEKPEEYDQIFNAHENLENEIIKIETHRIDLKDNDLNSVFEPVAQNIIIDIDSDEARKVMDKINKDAETYINELTFYPDDETYQGHWRTVSFFRINYYFNNDNNVLSIVTKANRYLYETASGFSEYKVYNIDVDTGKQLNNEELLKQYLLSFDDTTSIVNDYVKKMNMCSCKDAKDSNLYCYRGFKIDNESLLFFDGESINLILAVTLGIANENIIIPIIK